MQTRSLLFVATLLAAGLAGCLGGGDVSPDDSDGGAEEPVEFTEDTGAITGTVTDAEGLPVAEATVAIEGPDGPQETKTDETGTYGFSNLEPGTYEVFVQGLGHEAKAKPADVVPGEATRVDFTLSAVAVQAPHHTTYTQVGHIQCSTRTYPGVPLAVIIDPGWYTGVAVCGVPGVFGLPPVPVGSPDKFILFYNLDEPDTEELYLEMTWESTQSLGKGLSVIMELNGTANVEGIPPLGGDTGESPLVVHATRADLYATENATERAQENDTDIPEQHCLEDMCEIQTRAFAEANTTNADWPTDPPDVPVVGPPPDRMLDVGVVFDQRFDQYLTSFHFEEKPEGFSALPNE